MDNIKCAQIHLGKFGQNGEIIVSLLKSLSPLDVHNGTLVEGQVSPSDIAGSLEGKIITHWYSCLIIRRMLMYTLSHIPNGEIRGQIKTVNATNW